MAEGVANARVKINGTDVDVEALGQIIVEQDVDQPDMCSVVVNNTPDYKYSEKVNLGDALEVNIGSTGKPDAAGAQTAALFNGEVVGLEPFFDVKGETKVVVRAFHRLHRLTRKRHSKTFVNKNDAQIAQEIFGQHGISVQADSASIVHKHVYQHDLTDLEFLHQRARRINFEILCDGDKKVKFRKRNLSTDSGITIKWGKEPGEGHSLQIWRPRLSSANQVSKVNVRGWNSLKSEVIVGEGTSLETTMGASTGFSKAQSPFGENTAAFELAVYSKEEADALAKSLLEDAAMNYITGEGQAKGDPTIKAGLVVTLEAADKRFDGKYYLTGVTHRYVQKGGGPQGGYLTMIRFRRNAEGA